MSGLLRALLFFPLLLVAPLLSRGGAFEHTVTEEFSGELSPHATLLIDNVNGKIELQSGATDRYHLRITKKSAPRRTLR